MKKARFATPEFKQFLLERIARFPGGTATTVDVRQDGIAYLTAQPVKPEGDLGATVRHALIRACKGNKWIEWPFGTLANGDRLGREEWLARHRPGQSYSNVWRLTEVGRTRVRPEQNIPSPGRIPRSSVLGVIGSVKSKTRRNPAILPEDLGRPAADNVWEGALRRILVNAYERNREGRARCIKKYHAICFVCGFTFSKTYGDVGRNVIHVHHLKELSRIRENYELDPIRDLRPVCPNCHTIIHRRVPAYSIEEVKSFLSKVRRRSPRSV